MLRFLLLLLFPLLFLACGQPGGDGTTADEISARPVPAEVTDAPLDVAADRIMPKDQTEGTAEATPEHGSAEEIPLPEVANKPTVNIVDPKAGKTITLSGGQARKPSQDAVKTPPPPVREVKQPAPTAQPAPPAPPKPILEPAPAPVVEEVVEVEVEIPSPDPDHGAFGRLLKTYVDGSGRVDYAGLKKDEAKLDAYLKLLAENAPSDIWGRNEALAYWLNAYNAFTLKLILNNYPVASIKDLHGGKPWDVKWIKLDGATYSLNQIEHDIIRPRFKDPRIHFAVVCAAASCPPLANYAFDADIVTTQLDRLARQFINNDKFNQTEDQVSVSKIFDWYAEDFGDVRAYLNKYAATAIADDTPIEFMDYDWSLNKQ